MKTQVNFSSKGIQLYDWQVREYGMPEIIKSWIVRHDIQPEHLMVFVDQSSPAAIDAWKFRQLEAEGFFFTEEDYRGFEEDQSNRKKWRASTYAANSDKAEQEMNQIFMLISAAHNRLIEKYDSARQALVDAGYSEEEIQSIPMKTISEYKQEMTDASLLSSNDEWMLKEEIEQYQSDNETLLSIASNIASLLASRSEVSKIQQWIKDNVPVKTRRLVHNEGQIDSLHIHYVAENLYDFNEVVEALTH